MLVRRLALPIAALVLVAVLVVPGRAEEGVNPFEPLTAVAKHIDQGLAAVLEGKAPAEAFAPWTYVEPDEEGFAETRAKLKEAGVAKLKAVFLEFELLFFKGKDVVYRVRADLWTTAESVGVVQFRTTRYEAGEGPSASGGIPLAASDAAVKPFVKAALGLVAALTSGDGWEIAFADLDAIRKLVGDAMPIDEAKRDMEKAKKAIPEAVAALKELEPDRAVLELDDQGSLAFDAEGALAGALNGEFEYDREKGLSFQLKRFRAPPKR